MNVKDEKRVLKIYTERNIIKCGMDRWEGGGSGGRRGRDVSGKEGRKQGRGGIRKGEQRTWKRTENRSQKGKRGFRRRKRYRRLSKKNN